MENSILAELKKELTVDSPNSEMIKRIYADLESCWYLGRTEKKKRFEVELRKVKKLLEKETNQLLVEWFDSYIMD